MLREVATYVGHVLLATIGCLMSRNSFRHSSESRFRRHSGAGLLITSLSISLDSLGVRIGCLRWRSRSSRSWVTVSITTTAFTFVALAFGARLGHRYERGAERSAGAMLLELAALFAIEQMI